jgi:hypothetical protein
MYLINKPIFLIEMEIVMEDQVVRVDKEQEALSDADFARKLHKKERRLAARLEEAQEAEARALDRFQRAEVRLQRRRTRLERIKSNLMLVQKQIADSRITDQQPAQEAFPPSEAELDTPLSESEALSSSHTESMIAGTSEPEQEAVSISTDFSGVLAASGGEQGGYKWGHPTPRQGTSSPAPLMSAPGETTSELVGSSSSSIEPTTSTIIEHEPVASADSTTVEPGVDATSEVDTSPDSAMEREPTKPLRLEQEDQPAAGSLSPDIQSAKEAWVAAESAMQHARNTAHGIAASISFLSQTSEFSEKFMAELVYKQADANKALVKAQDAARLAYERFVQAQEIAEHAASQRVDVSTGAPGDYTRRKQENGALPAAEEDNAADQTVSMHAIRLYKL